MYPGADDGGCNTGGQITVSNQPDSCSSLADIGDEFFMSWPVENDDDQILHVAPHSFGNILQIVDHRRVDIHRAFA